MIMDSKTKLLLNRGDVLPIMETFYTIQGEGFHSGAPSYFIRIAGCDIGCQWCDVKESWDATQYPPIAIKEIIKDIQRYDPKIVVITGGEPLMWNLNNLTKALKDLNIKIHLETSGAYTYSGEFDWVCLSPKKMKLPLNEIKSIADEMKVVVKNKYDLIWAEKQREGLKDNCKLYLQSEWSIRKKIIPLILDYVKKNQYWSISLQSHKYINIP